MGRNQLRTTMATIETIVPLNQELGCYLLAKLYLLAAKRQHDVYNAIELWAHDARSTEAARGLDIAAAESRPLFAKKFKTWASGIRARAGQPDQR